MSADKLKWRINRAVRSSNLTPPARLVMFVLSDMADAVTGEIPEKNTPSLADLAHDTGHGESTVKTALTELERLGWVVRSRPDARARARHVPTRYRIQVGAPGDERPVLKRKPRARSKPSDEASEGQEQAIENESEGQELTFRGPGANFPRARSKPSIYKDDDRNDRNDRSSAADAALPAVKAPKKVRKAAPPKPPDPIGDAAQELTVAFFERFKGRTAQPFPAVRGVVKTALEQDVPRDVIAHALDGVMASGYAVSGNTLTHELNRMWKATHGGSRTDAAQQRLDQSRRVIEEARRLDEAAAAKAAGVTQPPIMFALPPGRTA